MKRLARLSARQLRQTNTFEMIANVAPFRLGAPRSNPQKLGKATGSQGGAYKREMLGVADAIVFTRQAISDGAES